jgi:hypothetical protein
VDEIISGSSDGSGEESFLLANGVETVAGIDAGSLVIFSGSESLHRVSPVCGPAPRINCILTFEQQSGQMANAYSLEKFFGRTVEEQQAHLL